MGVRFYGGVGALKMFCLAKLAVYIDVFHKKTLVSFPITVVKNADFESTAVPPGEHEVAHRSM